MFESLKKKFSRTGDKLEEELKEEAKEENNLSDEEPQEKKSSFFSFGNKDKKDESSTPELPEADKNEEEPDSEEEKSRFNFKRDKEGSGGIFSFVREKTISEKHLEDILWDLEMELLEGDVAMEVASNVVDSVKQNLVGRKIKRSNDYR